MVALFGSLHRIVWRLLPFVALFACIALSIIQAGVSDSLAYLMALVAMLVTSFVLVRLKRLKDTRKLLNYVPALSTILVIGVALRLVWFFLFPTIFTSDSATYVLLANKLISGQDYTVDNTYAYWPAGYPLFLFAVHLGIFTISQLTIAVLNMTLYLMASVLLFKLGKLMFEQKPALFAVLLLALWPTHITLIGIASKELLVFNILLACVYLFLLSPALKIRLLLAILLGLGALIQPGSILFVSVFIVASWYKKEKFALQLASIAIYLLGMLMVISPWSYRNYQIFNEFVLISTNGGSNLYRANNELASGGYLAKGKVDLSHLGELARNARGHQLAKQWISENTTDFLQLSFRKMVLFLGGDSAGIYNSLRRSAQQPVKSAYVYYAFKFFSTLYWLILWICLLAHVNSAKIELVNDKELVAVALSFLYFFTVHAIFESNAKYHIPVVWALFILIAAYISDRDLIKTKTSKPIA